MKTKEKQTKKLKGNINKMSKFTTCDYCETEKDMKIFCLF